MPVSAPTLAAGHRTAGTRFPALFVAQALSLDVVAGVVCAAAFAASAAGATPGWGWWIALPGATWVVYALDHLLDTRPGRSVTTPRRAFHRRSRSILSVHVAVVAALSLIAGASLAPALRPLSVLLVVVSLLHLGLAQVAGDRFPKELTAAAVYTTAIWFGPLTLGASPDRWVWILAAAHGCAALANLLMFSLFEQAADAADGQASTAAGWGRRRLRSALGVVGTAGLILASAVTLAGPSGLRMHAIVLAAVVATPLALDRMPERALRGGAYRVCGDLVFLGMALPALLS